MAGGRLHAPATSDAELALAFDGLVRRFLTIHGTPDTTAVPLVDR